MTRTRKSLHPKTSGAGILAGKQLCLARDSETIVANRTTGRLVLKFGRRAGKTANATLTRKIESDMSDGSCRVQKL